MGQPRRRAGVVRGRRLSVPGRTLTPGREPPAKAQTVMPRTTNVAVTRAAADGPARASAIEVAQLGAGIRAAGTAALQSL